MEKIGKEISKFTLNDRWGLLNDAFALSIAGLGKVSSALSLVDNLRHEKECKLVTLLIISPCINPR